MSTAVTENAWTIPSAMQDELAAANKMMAKAMGISSGLISGDYMDEENSYAAAHIFYNACLNKHLRDFKHNYASVMSWRYGAVVHVIHPHIETIRFRSLRVAKVWIKKRRASYVEATA